MKTFKDLEFKIHPMGSEVLQNSALPKEIKDRYSELQQAKIDFDNG